MKFSSLSAVILIRVECTEIAGAKTCWNSYSFTVFHEGTIRPTFLSHLSNMCLPGPALEVRFVGFISNLESKKCLGIVDEDLGSHRLVRYPIQ